MQALLHANTELQQQAERLHAEHAACQAALSALQDAHMAASTGMQCDAPPPANAALLTPVLGLASISNAADQNAQINPAMQRTSHAQLISIVTNATQPLRRQLRRLQKHNQELEQRISHSERAAHAAEAVAEAAKQRVKRVSAESTAPRQSAAASCAACMQLQQERAALEQRLAAAEAASERARSRAKNAAARSATLESELGIALACLRKWEVLDAGHAHSGEAARMLSCATQTCAAELCSGAVCIDAGTHSAVMALLGAAQGVCEKKKLTTSFRQSVATASEAMTNSWPASAADAPKLAELADDSAAKRDGAAGGAPQLLLHVQDATAEALTLRVAIVHLQQGLHDAATAWHATCAQSNEACRRCATHCHAAPSMAQALQTLSSLAAQAAGARARRSVLHAQHGAPLPAGASADARAAAIATQRRLAAAQRAAHAAG